MNPLQEKLAQNLANVRERMARAAERSGRDEQAVKLIGVTKYVDVEQTRDLFQAGCQCLGESRPQVLWEKAEALETEAIEWHLIGHLQRNKIRRTLPLVTLIHSVDSNRLLQAIEEESARLERVTSVLLEVNVSGDDAKHGFAPQELISHFAELRQVPHVKILGLMCMAGLNSDQATTRKEFASLRELRDRLNTDLPPTEKLMELSMGMSRDFEMAIEEGATLVRIGSTLFQGIES